MKNADSHSDTVRSLLNGKSILLTGSTGFLAKAFLEKLLRTVPEIGRVHLLIRSSDFNHSLERGESDIFSSSIFDHLKENKFRDFTETVRTKVRLVSGDTSLPRLGMSAKDYLALTDEVDLIVNAAASTDFMNRLDAAVTTNAMSTRHLALFLKDAKKARLLHVSTCYVNEFINGPVAERSYPQPEKAKLRLPLKSDATPDLDAILQLLQIEVDALHLKFRHKPEELNRMMVESGLKMSRAYGWNNVYTFTKWLGEKFLMENSSRIQCSIVRPAIVESCLLAPHAGWIEGWKVGDPLIYAVGTNRIPIFPARNETIIDIVPVDLVANAMFVAIPELLTRTQPDLKIYQSCGGSENPLRVADVTRIIRAAFGIDNKTSPPKIMPPWVWRAIHSIVRPIGTLARTLLGSNGRTEMLGKLLQMADIYSPYTALDCVFQNSELVKAHAQLGAIDQEQYSVSCAQFQWADYLGEIHIEGMFKHLLRKPSPIQKLRKAQ